MVQCFLNENFSQEIVGNFREVKVSANPTAIIIVSYLQTVLRLVSVISLLPFTTTFLALSLKLQYEPGFFNSIMQYSPF